MEDAAGQPPEHFRAREVYRYFQPTATPSRENAAPFASPIPSENPMLTTFSQLLAIRLQCKHSMISLIDKDNQYIVAESTRSVSIFPSTKAPLTSAAGHESSTEAVEQSDVNDSNHDKPQGHSCEPGDEIWLGGGTRIDRKGGLCENTLVIYPFDTYTAPPDAPLPVLEIPDLSKDARFQSRPYVTDNPAMRYYAGVPLRTKSGLNIGSLCVLDNETRPDRTGLQGDFLTPEEREFMQNMAKVVISYLEEERDGREGRKRAKMWGALGGFVTMSTKSMDSGVSSEERNSIRSGGNDSIAPSDPLASLTSANQLAPIGDAKSRGGTSVSSGPADGGTSGFTRVFNTAATLIKRAIAVDGVVFLDADSGILDGANMDDRGGSISIGGSSGVSILASAGVDSRDMDHKLSEHILLRLVSDFPQGRIFYLDEKDMPSSNDTGLASADGTESDSASDSDSPGTMSPNQRSSRIARQYRAIKNFCPNSKAAVFVPLYDHYNKPFACLLVYTCEPMHVFESEDLAFLIAFCNSIMAEISRLTTLSADRAKGDFISSISHELRSPLHGILASIEFLLETKMDGYQKGFVDTVESCGKTLLDTINHVLDFSKLIHLGRKSGRGPRKKAPRDKLQKVSSSSAVSSLGSLENAKKERKHTLPGLNLSESGTTTMGGVMAVQVPTDIAAVTEEVVQVVYAGHEFKPVVAPRQTPSAPASPTSRKRAMSLKRGTPYSRSSSPDLGTLPPDEEVVVILDLDKSQSWAHITQPGAFRRIVMNIFGNALKYTTTGYVHVHLSANKQANPSRPVIELTISDSGKGISREFLKTELFTPFSQENVLASGTGLGMSIVKQIVETLGGTISVRSQLGKGTEVKVCLPMTRAPADTPSLADVRKLSVQSAESAAKSMEANAFLNSVASRSLGKKCCIRGAAARRKGAALMPQPEKSKHAWDLLIRSCERYAKEWFGMVVVGEQESPDFVFALDPDVSPDSSTAHLPTISLLGGRFKTTSSTIETLVTAHSTDITTTTTTTTSVARLGGAQEDIHYFSGLPCGPFKLAKALWWLLEALERGEATPPASHESPMATRAFELPSQREWNLLDDEQASPTTEKVPRLPAPYAAPIPRSNSVSHLLSTIQDATEAVVSTLSSLSLTEEPEEGDELRTPAQVTTIAKPKPSILVVEDNPINLRLLTTFLSRAGYDYEEAQNGLVALHAFEKRPGGFDVILMDLQMPIMSGLDSTKAIRKVEQLRGTPSRSLIIALTGLATNSDMDDGFACGVNRYYTKPVSFKVVRSDLEAWSEQRLWELTQQQQMGAESEMERKKT